MRVQHVSTRFLLLLVRPPSLVAVDGFELAAEPEPEPENDSDDEETGTSFAEMSDRVRMLYINHY